MRGVDDSVTDRQSHQARIASTAEAASTAASGSAAQSLAAVSLFAFFVPD